MADLYGNGAFLGVGRQSAWLTAVARTAFFSVVSSSLQRKPKYVQRESLAHSSSFNARSFYLSEDRAGGSVEMLLQYEGFGLWLEAMLGEAPATTGPASGLYTHTFLVGASLPAGLSVEVQRGTGTSELFVGCRVAKGVLKIETGKEAKFTADLVARTSEARTTAITPTWTVRRDYVANHQEAGSFLWNSVNYTVDRLELSVDNKLAPRQSLGSALAAELPRSGMMEIKVTLDLVWTSDNFNNALTAHTVSDGVISFTAAAPAGATLTITANAAFVDSVSDAISTAGVIKQTVTLICQADSGNEGLSIVLVNTQSNPLAG